MTARTPFWRMLASVIGCRGLRGSMALFWPPGLGNTDVIAEPIRAHVARVAAGEACRGQRAHAVGARVIATTLQQCGLR